VRNRGGKASAFPGSKEEAKEFELEDGEMDFPVAHE